MDHPRQASPAEGMSIATRIQKCAVNTLKKLSCLGALLEKSCMISSMKNGTESAIQRNPAMRLRVPIPYTAAFVGCIPALYDGSIRMQVGRLKMTRAIRQARVMIRSCARRKGLPLSGRKGKGESLGPGLLEGAGELHNMREQSLERERFYSKGLSLPGGGDYPGRAFASHDCADLHDVRLHPILQCYHCGTHPSSSAEKPRCRTSTSVLKRDRLELTSSRDEALLSILSRRIG